MDKFSGGFQFQEESFFLKKNPINQGDFKPQWFGYFCLSINRIQPLFEGLIHDLGPCPWPDGTRKKKNGKIKKMEAKAMEVWFKCFSFSIGWFLGEPAVHHQGVSSSAFKNFQPALPSDFPSDRELVGLSYSSALAWIITGVNIPVSMIVIFQIYLYLLITSI